MDRHIQPLTAEELAQIVDRRYAALVLYAKSWNLPEAEDVVQSALLKLADVAGRGQGPENPVAWLYTAVRNEAISRHRKTLARRKHETESARQRADWFLPGENPVFSREAAEKLGELPDEQREIVLLRIWGQLSFEEIARLTESPKTTVHRTYKTALESLREKLQ